MATTSNSRRINDGDIIERDGLKFRVSIERDDSAGEPWKEHDGHGPVSEWRAKDSKRPGERVLHADRHSARFYDIEAAQKIALRDQWGLRPDLEAALAVKKGRLPTRKEIAAEAVEADFERLQAWCRDEWEWVFVEVTLVNAGHGKHTYDAAIGGIESDSGAYIAEVVDDLIAEVRAEYAQWQCCPQCEGEGRVKR